MNGPIAMYKLKPVVHFPDPVDLTPTMYGMKNIYRTNVSSAGGGRRSENPPNVLEQESTSEVETLKKRQEGILKQLIFLKEQMMSLREELTKGATSKGTSEVTETHQRINANPQWNGLAGEIVICASPENAPYSLLAVSKLWPNVLRLHVTCHTHSSVVSLPTHLSCFFPLSLTTCPNVRARVIWNKMSPDCELVVSPVSHSPIRGEVNVLRFLYRSIDGFGDPMADTQLDHVLDICHRLVHANTQRDRLMNVRALNALLGRADWLGGDSATIADAAAWSAIRNIPSIELSQNMTRWNTRCNQAFEVSAA